MTPAIALGMLAGVLAALAAWADGAWPPVALLQGWVAATAAAAALAAVLALACWRAGRPLAAACAGAWLAALALRTHDAHLLPPAAEERTLATARIEGLPARSGGSALFTATLEPLTPGTALVAGTRASLRWDEAPPLRPGERWRLLVVLHAPPGSAHPGSPDQRLQSLRLGLQAAGHVVASPLDARVAAGGWQLDRLRARLSAWIAARVPERDSAALLAALAVGDTQRVSPEQWRVFNAVGITHLVAISGMHVAAFSLVAGWLAARAWGALPWLRRRCARTTAAAAVGLCAATAYALLAGWSVPTQRTLVMLACWHGLHALARRREAATTLAVGLAGVLLADPLAPLAPGFWLSFLAVGSLLVAGALAPAGRHAQREPRWRALLAEQAWVGLALLPVGVAVFGSFSVVGLAVNLAAIPFFSGALVPLVLGATAGALVHPALGEWPLQAAAWLARHAWPVLQACADWPHALWRLHPSADALALAAPALAVALLPWPPWMRASALLALLPLAVPPASAPARGELVATVFDAGRGQAILLRTSDHALLLDVGEVHGGGGSFAARVLVPALQRAGLARLDGVVVPALDEDRGAGIAALDAALAAPPPLWMALDRHASSGSQALPPEASACGPGTRWNWDGVGFEWLPGTGCALRAGTGAAALLWTGAERGAGLRVLADALAPTAIVVVPGQGAAAAHVPALVDAAQARVALLGGTARDASRATVRASAAAWCASGAQVLALSATATLELRMPASGPIRIAMPRRAQVSCPIGLPP